MNLPWVPVRRRPRVAILATGDEVVMPGEPLGPSQIVSSNGLALSAFVRACGGEPLLLPIAADTEDSLVEHERSEEHTSELQSLMRHSYAVFCLKKKNTVTTDLRIYTSIA